MCTREPRRTNRRQPSILVGAGNYVALRTTFVSAIDAINLSYDVERAPYIQAQNRRFIFMNVLGSPLPPSSTILPARLCFLPVSRTSVLIWFKIAFQNKFLNSKKGTISLLCSISNASLVKCQQTKQITPPIQYAW